MADDLVSRLSETLDELERVARAATDGPWRYRPMKLWHDPPRIPWRRRTYWRFSA